MEHQDYNKMLSCPRCGDVGAIYLLKVAGDKLIIKQRCPKHGGRSFKLPLMEKNILIPHIRNAIFRCFKCGQEAKADLIKESGPWTLIRCDCPTHGNKLPFQKIWSVIYTEISSEPVVQSQPAQPQPIPSEENMFCPDCGMPMEGSQRFCGSCGAEVD